MAKFLQYDLKTETRTEQRCTSWHAETMIMTFAEGIGSLSQAMFLQKPFEQSSVWWPKTLPGVCALMDIVTAFLNADLDDSEVILLHPPPHPPKTFQSS